MEKTKYPPFCGGGEKKVVWDITSNVVIFLLKMSNF